jgi:SAM-dependent methyltransferase
LTELVHLDALVNFVHGNAEQMPFTDHHFDVVIGQEAWCHVPDKARLISECARVVKPGGVIAFTDIIRTDKLSNGDLRRLRSEMTFPNLETINGYRGLLEHSGCTLLEHDDLSDVWTRILQDRLAMYRSLSAETEKRFGVERAQQWDDAYAFFVSRYRQGKLGGGRFIARRDQGTTDTTEEEAV